MKTAAAIFATCLIITGCGGGGVATRAAGNISVHAGDNAVITLSQLDATQAAEKTIDAGKVDANATAANAQGGSTAASGDASKSDTAPRAVKADANATE